MTMFSSDEPLEEENPSDPLPEDKRRPATAKTLTQRAGRPRTLTLPEKIEAWHRHAMGEDISELSITYQTSIVEVQEALDSAAQELGYPYNHVDPELERFLILHSSDRMKSGIVKLLNSSNKILEDIKTQLRLLKEQREDINISRETSLDELKLLEVISKQEENLEHRYQAQIKSMVLMMGEFRANNILKAELTGIKRSKPVRKAKQVANPIDALEALELSDAELIEIAKSGEEAA